MTHLTVSDHATGTRNGYPSWTVSRRLDGKKVGTIWETEQGYAGEIAAPNKEGGNRHYLCPELMFRQSVLDQLEKMAPRLGLI